MKVVHDFGRALPPTHHKHDTVSCRWKRPQEDIMFSINSNENSNINSEEQEYMQEQQRKQQVTINEQMLTIGDMEAKVRTMENNARVLNGIIETKTNAQREMESEMFQLREQIKAHRQVIDDQARKIDNMQRDIAYGKRLHEEETKRANDHAASLIDMTMKYDDMVKQRDYFKDLHDAYSRDNAAAETQIAQKDEQITALQEEVRRLRKVELRFNSLRDHAQSINGPFVEHGWQGDVEAEKPKRKVRVNFDAIDEEFDIEDDEDFDDAVSRIMEMLKERMEEDAETEKVSEYDDDERRKTLARHSIMELMQYVIDEDITMTGHDFDSAALFKYDLIDAIVADETSDDDE